MSKKILFILPSLCRAGAETQTVDLINGISSDDFDKYFLTFEKNLDQYERIDHENVKYIHCERKKKIDLTLITKIAHIIDSEKIELVHCSLQIALLMGWLGVKFSKTKPQIVLAVHTTLNRNKRNDLADKYIYQWLMRSCKKIIFVCKTQESHWLKKFPSLKGNTVVIYNGVDPHYFDPNKFKSEGDNLREKLNIPASSKVLCHIAAFRPEKGHLILVNAFRDVLVSHPDVYLVFAGDGLLRQKVEEKLAEYDIENNIHFLGNIPDVRPLLAMADVTVLPSTAVETFSIAMLESMSMNTPLVATNMGGIAEAVLHDKTGMIVEPGNATVLASALTDILSDENKCQHMSLASRELIINNFTKRKMLDETASLLLVR